MNDTINQDGAAIFAAGDAASAKAGFNPHLGFYHANAKNSGAAIKFSVEPATPDRDGAVYFSIAKQKTVAEASAAGTNRFASFDWANKATVKLNFLETAEMAMVFGGQTPSLVHAGKEGLFHNSPSATTSVTLKRAEDPSRPGFVLGVGRTPKADPNARQYFSFVFWPAEAFGLRAALMAQMGLLAFGIPKERAAAPALSRDDRPAAGPFPPPPAASAFAANPRATDAFAAMPTPAGAFAPRTEPFGAASAAAPADDAFGDAF